MEKSSVLLITCSVGYGHLAAAKNIEQRLHATNPGLKVHYLDTREYFPRGVGEISDQWDNQMRKGNFAVSLVSHVQRPYEAFYDYFLDHRLTRDLIKLCREENIDTVYDMQPVFTASLYKAVAQARGGQGCTYHKILTDLPTSRNKSYFMGIDRLRLQEDLPFKLHSPQPLLSQNQTEESFWRQHCKLPPVHLESTFALPVHPDYLTMPAEINQLKIEIDPHWNLQLPLPSDSFVTTLMLGSQGVNAIYDYVTSYLAQIQKHQPSQQHYLFIACSKNEALYRSLQELLDQHLLHRTTNHRVVPLRMQSLEAIASLMWRSNQILIRSGGISSLEQLALAQGRPDRPKLWIHSGYKGHEPSALIDYTYAWERGNAEYLIHHLGAQMTAPQLVKFFE